MPGRVLNAFSGDELVYNKTLGDWRTHNGVDYACTQGAAVAAPVAGKVVSAGAEGNWGTVVVLEDAAGRSWRLCGVADPAVKAGDTVAAGQKLGTVGTVGCECAEENHIHVEVKAGRKLPRPGKAAGISKPQRGCNSGSFLLCQTVRHVCSSQRTSAESTRLPAVHLRGVRPSAGRQCRRAACPMGWVRQASTVQQAVVLPSYCLRHQHCSCAKNHTLNSAATAINTAPSTRMLPNWSVGTRRGKTQRGDTPLSASKKRCAAADGMTDKDGSGQHAAQNAACAQHRLHKTKGGITFLQGSVPPAPEHLR